GMGQGPHPPEEPGCRGPGGQATPSHDLGFSDVDAWGRSAESRRLARGLFDPVYRWWFRAEWEHLERIPRSGPALLVANHAGAIPADAPVIMHGIERETGRAVYGLADVLFPALPVVGTLWSRLGGVVAHPDNAHRLLHDEGHLVLVFPEGTKGTSKLWSERYRLARFGRGGFVETAMRAGAPIVPVAVVGSEEAMPILARSNLVAKALRIPYAPLTANMVALGPLGVVTWFPAKFRLRVLEPVTFDVAPGQSRYPRSMVMDAAEAIRTSIGDALFDMLSRRRSVWFG
ncbi:MAG: lysophospholipid acyltransferase family protein, partial [Acidimicrobiia bacterium]